MRGDRRPGDVDRAGEDGVPALRVFATARARGIADVRYGRRAGAGREHRRVGASDDGDEALAVERSWAAGANRRMVSAISCHRYARYATRGLSDLREATVRVSRWMQFEQRAAVWSQRRSSSA